MFKKSKTLKCLKYSQQLNYFSVSKIVIAPNIQQQPQNVKGVQLLIVELCTVCTAQ